MVAQMMMFMISGVRNEGIRTENSLKIAFFVVAVFDQKIVKFHSEKSSNMIYLGYIDFMSS